MTPNLSDLTPDEYLIVEIDGTILRQYAPDLLLHEGIWRSADAKGWSYRVDAENPDIRQKRHVHVARDEHTRSKDQQVAWNSDGSRHDKKTFNSNIGGLKTAKQIARQALKLPDDIILEDITEQSDGAHLLTEALRELHTQPAKAALVAARYRDSPWERLL